MDIRIANLRSKFEELKIDAFISGRLSNVRYLCGYSGSNGLLFVTKDNSYFLTDFRYQEQVKEEVSGAECIIIKTDFPAEFKDNPKLKFKGKVGIEAPHITFDMYSKLKEAMPDCEFVSTSNVVEMISSVKDEGELAKIRKAVEMTDKVFAEVVKLVKPGVTERELAAELVYRHLKHGASGDSFEAIVGSGYRGALPHGIASDKKIEKGDFIVFDFGCIYQGYCSDMTRTIVVGEPSKKHLEVYNVVKQAQQAAVDACKAGMNTKVLDAVARDIIKEAGYGDNYGHGLGHGLGIEVHAEPRVTFLVENTLQVNQVITIEPGIYLSGWGGVRIEDDVVVKEGGCEILTNTTKELIVV
ncbi:aminopeptidase P family protein [bacterium]|nr:aminopeptidase P family protein [bacterium]